MEQTLIKIFKAGLADLKGHSEDLENPLVYSFFQT